MSYQRDDDSRLVEVDAALEHLRQIKEDTVKMIVSLQRERDANTPKSNPTRKR
jgi:hypothetical protein